MNRIYLVTNIVTNERYLRIAPNTSQALKSIVAPTYLVSTVTPMELYILQQEGLQVESAVPEDDSNVITE